MKQKPTENKNQKTAQHTPGPWLYDGTITELGAPIWTTSNGWVCVLPKSKYTEANAHLIASSPQLLEAAKCALDFIRSIKSCIPDWDKRLKVSGEGYSDKLRAAIARAEDFAVS